MILEHEDICITMISKRSERRSNVEPCKFILQFSELFGRNAVPNIAVATRNPRDSCSQMHLEVQEQRFLAIFVQGKELVAAVCHEFYQI